MSTTAVDGSTWYYTEDGESVHTSLACPALAQSEPLSAQTYYQVPGNRPLCGICKRRSGAKPYEGLERWVCEVVDADLEHVPDRETQAYDARLLADVTEDGELVVADASRVPVTSSIEIKTCARRIDDAGSNGGNRRGRWCFVGRQHRRLKRNGGWYLLVVLEDGKILESRLVHPPLLDEQLADRWTSSGGHYDEECRLPWSALLDPAEVVA